MQFGEHFNTFAAARNGDDLSTILEPSFGDFGEVLFARHPLHIFIEILTRSAFAIKRFRRARCFFLSLISVGRMLGSSEMTNDLEAFSNSAS